MAEYSYDVTNPNDGISTVRSPSKRSNKIVYFLSTVILILIGVIIYILLFTEYCSLGIRNAKLFGNPNKIETTTEARSTIGQIIMKTTSKAPTQRTEDDLEKITCKSSECIQTAAHIMSSMDLAETPCKNFYEYSCGKMDLEKKETLDIFAPKLYSAADTPNFLKKFRTFYESCVSHEDRFDYEIRLNRTKALLGEVGLFNVHGQKKKDLDITDFIANLVLYDAMPLFDIDVDIDAENSTYIMKLIMPDQRSLDLGHWSPLVETKRKCLRKTAEKTHDTPLNMSILYNELLLCQKDYGDYLDSISTTVQQLKIFSNLSESEAHKRLFDIRVFIEFEILSRFDQIPLPPNLEEQNVKRQYEEINIGQLEKEFPIIGWEKFFKTISNVSVASGTKIQMYNRDYFEDIFQQLSSLPPERLNDAFLSILATSLYVNTVLPSHRHSREKYCEERSRAMMPDIVNYLYKEVIETEHLNKQNADVELIYDVLKQRFRNSLQNRKWLNESAKSSILKKLDKIKLALFKTDDIQSEKNYLEEAYRNMHLQSDHYQLNQFRLIKFGRRRLFSLHGKKVSSEDMFRHFVDATDDEPVYFYANDIVCIPHGLARRAEDNIPSYLVLAQIGFPIAKIIGRAFDRIGIGYGVVLSNEIASTYKYFADKTRNMILLTNPISFEEKILYFNVNNDLSESERIADNTALRLLTESFTSFENQPLLPWISREFSREKLFFLLLTQGLCRKMDIMKFITESHESPVLPAQFRVQSMLLNSQEFSKTFRCPPDSEMNRLKDRLQFPHL